MLDVLAQTYSTTYNSTASPEATAGFFMGKWLVFVVVAIVALWKVFTKAGVEGWKAIIPIYNGWVLAEIAGEPGWWAIVGLGGVIPIIGFVFGIAALVLYVLIALELAKKFGKDTVFAVFGLIIFSLIGLLILGFGDAKYEGSVPAKATPSTSGGNSQTPPAQNNNTTTPPSA